MLNSELLALQQRLQAAVLSDEAPVFSGQAGVVGVAGERGLAAYRHAYRARLLAALRDNYAVLHQALGDEAFDAMGLAYLAAHPSVHASIRWFGDRLPEFLAGAGAALLPHPALLDLARMDWALRGAFDAPDDQPLQAATLASLPPEQWAALRLRPRASAQLLALHWAIAPAWRALLRQTEGEPAGELAAPEPLQQLLLVWRRGLQTQWRMVTGLEAALWTAVFDGASFAALCALAASEAGEQEAAARVIGHLQQWLAEESLAEQSQVAPD
ncbi:DNA-binding domain-containing protein [Paucibacter sp. APW11]|uniref:DNA-binding domain-containing protein n=1 Tax=Roseateles aquae TaxID=3077235 RepID=A0ABU3PH04_9BURK|nr:DNA-binding domain-containing protein [Paucibacter sp. APW11]MDT9001838.1 DNA-binding domain-containing protein [Paucibacter sp. APW11]